MLPNISVRIFRLRTRLLCSPHFPMRTWFADCGAKVRQNPGLWGSASAQAQTNNEVLLTPRVAFTGLMSPCRQGGIAAGSILSRDRTHVYPNILYTCVLTVFETWASSLGIRPSIAAGWPIVWLGQVGPRPCRWQVGYSPNQNTDNEGGNDTHKTREHDGADEAEEEEDEDRNQRTHVCTNIST